MHAVTGYGEFRGLLCSPLQNIWGWLLWLWLWSEKNMRKIDEATQLLSAYVSYTMNDTRYRVMYYRSYTVMPVSVPCTRSLLRLDSFLASSLTRTCYHTDTSRDSYFESFWINFINFPAVACLASAWLDSLVTSRWFLHSLIFSSILFSYDTSSCIFIFNSKYRASILFSPLLSQKSFRDVCMVC